MRSLIKILFGVEPDPVTEGGSLRLSWEAMPGGDWALVVLVAIVLGAWGTLWLYRREGRGLTLRTRLLLTSLRMVAVLGVIAMLLEPVLVFVKKEYSPSSILVLQDVSASMELTDAYPDRQRAQKIAEVLRLPGGTKELGESNRLQLTNRAIDARLREALAANGDRTVQVLPFTGKLLPASATQPSEASGGGIDTTATGIGTAIREAISGHRGQKLAGVLLITDGQSNAGEPVTKAAEFAKAEGVPVVVLAAGTPEGPRDATLKAVEANPVVFVKDNNQIGALIEARGMAGTPATVVLERRREGSEWEEAGRQNIALPDTGQVQTVTFDYSEDKPTRLEFRVTIADAGPEMRTSDNFRTAEVRVIPQKIRVLFIAGSSFPEVQFVRNALLRDKGVDVSTWLQAADDKYEHPGTTPIRRLPVSAEELNAYDCIVLYDPDPERWPADYPRLLTDFVAQAGGGLVYVAGERMTKRLFDAASDPQNAWLSMLPVVVEPGLFRTEVSMRLSSREPWKLEITPEGRTDPIFQFAKTDEENERVLSSLPGMFWHFSVTRAKPGATVLARHGDPRMRNQYGQEVLLATQLVGPGRTFFVGFDSTYRWRYLDEQYFDGFWARLIDRAGRSKQLGGRYPYTLTTDRATYRPGSQVQLVARFVNPDDAGASLDVLQGEVESGELTMPVTLSPRAGEPGVFETSFAVSKPGPYGVRVWSGESDPTSPTRPRAATHHFEVELPNLEHARPGQDRATLASIAHTTGGAVFDLEQTDLIPGAFKIGKVSRDLEDRQEIMDAPILWGAILLAIFAEWVLRKKFRLV